MKLTTITLLTNITLALLTIAALFVIPYGWEKQERIENERRGQ